MGNKESAAILIMAAVLCPCGAWAQASAAASGGMLPDEVVIRGQSRAGKLSVVKPPLVIEVDPFESIKDSIKPDESLLLAISPLTVSWRRTHPEVLKEARVIQPWRMTFSPKPGITFRIRDQLAYVLQRKLQDDEADEYAWNLTIADEEGRVFHHYEGKDDPPEELVWSGQNDQEGWIQAGRSYSAIYTFTDKGGSPRTRVGRPLLFKGIVHQEASGLHVSLDSSVLFGPGKSGYKVTGKRGHFLLRAASDLIKRRFSGIPLSVRVFAASKALAMTQGASVSQFLLKELMMPVKNLNVSSTEASYSDQRVEIVLLNR